PLVKSSVAGKAIAPSGVVAIRINRRCGVILQNRSYTCREACSNDLQCAATHIEFSRSTTFGNAIRAPDFQHTACDIHYPLGSHRTGESDAALKGRRAIAEINLPTARRTECRGI